VAPVPVGIGSALALRAKENAERRPANEKPRKLTVNCYKNPKLNKLIFTIFEGKV
jgi:hypothetical protein